MQVFRTGGIEVTCLCDGTYTFTPEDFPETTPSSRAQRLAAAGLTDIDTVFNAWLLRHPGGTMLVDTGCGDSFAGDVGQLPARLAACGVAPGDIDTIVLTHLHADHAGGLLPGGAPAYPSARVLVHRAELDYWQGRDALRTAILSACAAQIVPLDDDVIIAPGIAVWSLPGHTPGHIGLRIGADLALIGDVLHSEALQLPEPETRNANDVDRATAEASRRACLDTLVDEGLVWSGSHMLGPGAFARLAREGAGYRRTAP